MKLNNTQRIALAQLKRALQVATDCGLFDEIASNISHPDRVNAFCDDVAETVQALGAGIKPEVEANDLVMLRLVLDVTYDLHGESVSDIRTRMNKAVFDAIGNGLLTGETEAEVETYSIEVEALPDWAATTA
jgi:hypothetical protein